MAVGASVHTLTLARVALAPATVPATQAVDRMTSKNDPGCDVDALELGLAGLWLCMLIGVAIAMEDAKLGIAGVVLVIASAIVYKMYCRLALNDLHNEQLEVEKHRLE